MDLVACTESPYPRFDSGPDIDFVGFIAELVSGEYLWSIADLSGGKESPCLTDELVSCEFFGVDFSEGEESLCFRVPRESRVDIAAGEESKLKDDDFDVFGSDIDLASGESSGFKVDLVSGEPLGSNECLGFKVDCVAGGFLENLDMKIDFVSLGLKAKSVESFDSKDELLVGKLFVCRVSLVSDKPLDSSACFVVGKHSTVVCELVFWSKVDLVAGSKVDLVSVGERLLSEVDFSEGEETLLFIDEIVSGELLESKVNFVSCGEFLCFKVVDE